MLSAALPDRFPIVADGAAAVVVCCAALAVLPIVPKPLPARAVSFRQMRAQVAAWRVAAVVAVTPRGSFLADYLTAVLGPPAAAAGDVVAWRG